MSHIDEVKQRFGLDEWRVVDIGAGTGVFASQLAAAGAQVTGIEVDPAKVAKAESQFGAVARFHIGRAEAIPLPDASVDLVTVLYAWHHIPSSVHPLAATEIARILKPGASLYVAEPETSGPMTEIIFPLEDETEVRTAAAAFLENMGNFETFRSVEKTGYMLTRRYRSFEDLVEAVVYIDPQRVNRFESTKQDVLARFERLARPDGDGFLIDQPTKLFVFERA